VAPNDLGDLRLVPVVPQQAGYRLSGEGRSVSRMRCWGVPTSQEEEKCGKRWGLIDMARENEELDALPPDILEAYLEVTRCYSKLLDRLARE